MGILFSSSITSRIDGYRLSVEQAVNDDQFFHKFRSDPYIIDAYEHVSSQLGTSIYRKLLHSKSTYLYQYKEQYEKNDRIGQPKIEDYSIFGKISPTTLRYVHLAGEILELFPINEESKIVEIGCGYGGQCSIFSSITGFKSFELIDLDFVLPLIDKFLKQLDVQNYKTTDLTNCGKEDEYDLFISNYGISECDKDVQRAYVEKVIRKCKCGFVVYNYIPGQDKRLQSLEGFCNLLKEYGINPKMREETVQTNFLSKNYVIYWGDSH